MHRFTHASQVAVLAVVALATLGLVHRLHAEDQPGAKPPALKPLGQQLLYTTYFYTAAEAIVHAFEKGTEARLISMADGGTVWTGKLDAGQTALVKTGRGVFSFVADKKASILVGTPNSGPVLGYYLRNQDGGFRGDRLFSALPSSTHSADCRVIVWAWEDCEVNIGDLTTDQAVEKVALEKGTFHEITGPKLAALCNHVLDFRADKKAISVLVYYDEGFTVPASDGRGAGRLFYTYAGKITEGKNDVNVMCPYGNAKVTIEDLKEQKVLWSGEVGEGQIKTLTLSGVYVKVTSDVDLNVTVAPYEHYKALYAEHHFAAGGEGFGIENDFLVTTPGELWVFSYYPGNSITVTNQATGAIAWKGELNAGQVQDVNPGYGFYRVRSTKGVSVMGGYGQAGGDFSPASNLFAIDEALFKVVREIKEERVKVAAAQGKVLKDDEANAPLNATEMARAQQEINQQTGRKNISVEEVNDSIQRLQSK